MNEQKVSANTGFALVEEENQESITPDTTSQKPRMVTDLTADEFASIIVNGVVAGIQAVQLEAEQQKRDYIFQPQLPKAELDPASAADPAPLGMVDRTLGTIGSTLHGVVDVAEGLLRGTVDIITLGAAKRN